MPTLNLLLQRTTHPQRKPHVRSTTFIDGKGPPPFAYFDETQDHLGALFHAALGWQYSADPEDFGSGPYRPVLEKYLGAGMLITKQTSSVALPSAIITYRRNGTWDVAGFVGMVPWEVEASSGFTSIEGDFLMTARVLIQNRTKLDTVANHGFLLTNGIPGFLPSCLGFACGSDLPNWQIFYAADTNSSPSFADSGIPIPQNTGDSLSGWYTLQVSRVAGAVRWFINGALVRLNGAEGLYYPGLIRLGGKYVRAGNSRMGPSGAGYTIDMFHLFASRSST